MAADGNGNRKKKKVIVIDAPEPAEMLTGQEPEAEELTEEKMKSRADKRKSVEQLIFGSMEPQLVDFRKGFFARHPGQRTGWRKHVRLGLDIFFSNEPWEYEGCENVLEAIEAVFLWEKEYQEENGPAPELVFFEPFNYVMKGVVRPDNVTRESRPYLYRLFRSEALNTIEAIWKAPEELQKSIEINKQLSIPIGEGFFTNPGRTMPAIDLDKYENFIYRLLYSGLDEKADALNDAKEYTDGIGLENIPVVVPGSMYQRLMEKSQDKKLPVIKAAKADRLKYAHDAVTLALQGVKDAASDGQMTLSGDSLPGVRNTISIGVDFTALTKLETDREDIDPAGLKQKITDYDLLAASAVGSIWLNDGGREPHSTTTTLEQIYKTMGGKTSPNTQQTKTLLTSLLKSNCVVVAIDNSEEVENKAKYKKRTIYGTLIDAVFDVEANVNGSVTDMAVTITRGALLTEFADERGHTVTIKRKCLQVLTLKDGDIRIKTTLINELVMVLNPKNKNKYSNEMTFNRIFQKADFKGKKSRGVEKVEKVLEHYKQTKIFPGFHDYMILSDRIIINPTKDQWKRLGQ